MPRPCSEMQQGWGTGRAGFGKGRVSQQSPTCLSENEFPCPTVADLHWFRFRPMGHARHQEHARQGTNRRGNAGSRDAGIPEAFLWVIKTDVSTYELLRAAITQRACNECVRDGCCSVYTLILNQLTVATNLSHRCWGLRSSPSCFLLSTTLLRA